MSECLIALTSRGLLYEPIIGSTESCFCNYDTHKITCFATKLNISPSTQNVSLFFPDIETKTFDELWASILDYHLILIVDNQDVSCFFTGNNNVCVDELKIMAFDRFNYAYDMHRACFNQLERALIN
jgi:hypothetical protein